jgi:hypothetical protein
MPQGANQPNFSRNPVAGDLRKFLKDLQDYSKILKSISEPRDDRLTKIIEFLEDFDEKIEELKRNLSCAQQNKECCGRLFDVVVYIEENFSTKEIRGLFGMYYDARQSNTLNPTTRNYRNRSGDEIKKLAKHLENAFKRECIHDVDVDVDRKTG